MSQTAKRAGHKSTGKTYVTYSKNREDEVSEIFIISPLCIRWVRGRFLLTRNGFKFLTNVKIKTRSIWNCCQGTLSVYDRYFFICSIKSPQCTDKCSKKIFRQRFSFPVFWCAKSIKFHFGGVQNRDTKNRRLGTIVTSIQDSKPREKQISHFLIVS